MPRNFVDDESLVKLIEMIRLHPALYDCSRKRDYKDVQLHSSIWFSIAEALDTEGKNSEFWKTRWRTLRDTYVRKKREIKNSSKSSTIEYAKKWKFLDIMSFLDSFIPEQCSPRARSSQGEGKDGAAEEGMDGSNEQSSARKYARLKSKLPDDVGRAILDMCNTAKKKKDEVKRDDMDSCFFEPYGLRLKKLPANVKAIVQLQIAQIFFNAENPHMPQELLSTLPQIPIKTMQTLAPVYQQQQQPLMVMEPVPQTTLTTDILSQAAAKVIYNG